MKKICGLIMLSLIFSICVSGCSTKQKASMIKSERRFAKYVERQSTTSSGVIDLSEGPKQRYDYNLGPGNPEFDFKIVNPY